MAATQQNMAQLRTLISSLPQCPPVADLAYCYLRVQDYLAAAPAPVAESPKGLGTLQARRQRPTNSPGTKASRSKASPTPSPPTSSQTQVLKRIVGRAGITTAQLCKAFPKVRANHMGITLTRLARNGSITGTPKTGPWTATESGIAAVNAPAVTNLGQARQRRGRPAKATMPKAEPYQDELQQTGT